MRDLSVSNLSVNAKYTIGMMFWMSLYVAALYASLGVILHGHPTGPWLYCFAVLPALPVGGSIFVVQRYMYKVDEYVREVLTKRFVTATGLTLFACTAWGFLENGANVHHFSLYLVYPLFWIMFACTCLVYRKAT